MNNIIRYFLLFIYFCLGFFCAYKYKYVNAWDEAFCIGKSSGEIKGRYEEGFKDTAQCGYELPSLRYSDYNPKAFKYICKTPYCELSTEEKFILNNSLRKD